MIALTFSKQHRSIQSFAEVQIPDFTIITGVNGSGKSHLLQAIENGSVLIGGMRANSGKIRHFDWSSLVPHAENTFEGSTNVRFRYSLISDAINRIAQAKLKARKELEKLKIPNFPPVDDQELFTIKEDDFRAKMNGDKSGSNLWRRAYEVLVSAYNDCYQGQGGAEPHKRVMRILAEDSIQKGIHPLLIGETRINQLVPLELSDGEVFQQKISELFVTYYRFWEENRWREFLNERHHESNYVFSSDEFERHFGGPPWEFLNKIIAEAGLNFEATQPTGRSDIPFSVKLRNKTSGAEVSFQDLSSGEKIVMSFVLCLYQARRTSNKIAHPDLLLLDEIDAPLHPSMTKGLINIIENVLVKETGMKVIMTTHSPSTVAFAPVGSLFRLETSPRQLVQCTKDEAIQTLTSGYISVTDGSRFVITEAHQDRKIYEMLFKKLVQRERLTSRPNLVFMQASDEKDTSDGGRAQVRNWSQKLSEAGMKNIYGLIDRDDGNQETPIIKVLRRYSIENYLLDPIIVYAWLMDKKKHGSILDIGIRDFDFHQLKYVEEKHLQNIAARVCGFVEADVPNLHRQSKGEFEVQYVSGKTVTLPAWIRDHRGHDLVSIFRECFRSKLNLIVTADNCNELASLLIDRLPDFIPTELLEIFRDFQAEN